MAHQHLAREPAQPDPADLRRRAGEVAVHQLRREPDRLEHLRAAVGRHGRDAHLRHRLQQPRAEPGDDPVAREPAVHGVGAVAHQAREVVHLARLARVDHERRPRPQPGPHQLVVHGRGGQQRGDGRALGPDAPVADDEDLRAAGDGLDRGGDQPLDGRLQPGFAERDRPRGVDRRPRQRRRAHAVQVLGGEDRRRQAQPARGRRRVGQQLRPAAEPRRQAHHQVLAQRVDRRVGDLREALLEVAEQRGAWSLSAASAESAPIEPVGSLPAWTIGPISTSRSSRVNPKSGAVCIGGSGQRGGHRDVLEPDRRLARPLPVRPPRRDLALHLAVGEHLAAVEVDDPQRAGLQAPALDDPGGIDRHRARLARQHDPAVVGLEPAAGAQPVAVELRAQDPPVGERDRRRAVPRLHDLLVVGVEAAQRLRAGRRGPPTPPAPSSSPRARAAGPRAPAARARRRSWRSPRRRSGSPAAPRRTRPARARAPASSSRSRAAC